MDVAVLGGAFDPPHVGHLFLAMATVRLHFARSVWIMPSPDRPDKSMVRGFDERIDLVGTAILQIPQELRGHIVPSTFERDLGTFRGSLFLMESLRKKFPTQRFGFVLGGDTLEKIATWNDPIAGVMTGTQFVQSVPCCIFARESQCSDHPFLTGAHKDTLCFGDLDSVAQELSLQMEDSMWQQARNSSHCYAEISSTRIRQELSSPTPDNDYLIWALGSRVMESVLKRSQ